MISYSFNSGALTPLVHGEATLSSSFLTFSTVLSRQVPPAGSSGHGFTFLINHSEGFELLVDDSIGDLGLASSLDQVDAGEGHEGEEQEHLHPGDDDDE